MKKIISWIVALSMMMSMVLTVNADETETSLDAFTKLDGTKITKVFKKNGTEGSVSDNKVALSNEHSAVMMYRNVNLDAGVDKAIVDLRAATTDAANIKIYAYPAGTAPFIDYTDNSFIRDTTTSGKDYNCEGGTLWKPSNGGEYTNVGTLSIAPDTDNVFAGWSTEGVYEIPITGGGALRGNYDIFVGANYGDFYGISFTEHKNNAYEYMPITNAIALGTTEVATESGSTFVRCSSAPQSLIVYKNVDFGEMGAKAMSVFAGGGNANLNMYFVRPDADNYTDKAGKLINGYTVNGNSLKAEGAGSNVGGTLWKNLTIPTSWSSNEVFFNLSEAHNGGNAFSMSLTGVYNVYVGLTYGNFYGIQFAEFTEADLALDINGTEFSAKNYYKKATYPSADANTGVFGAWANGGANNGYAMWYANFGETAAVKTVDVYYGAAKVNAGAYVSLYADEVTEENRIARGVMTYQDGMDWGVSDKYITIPVTKALTGIHKLYLKVETSGYTTSDDGAGDITKFVFNDVSGYKQTSNVYGNALHTSVIYNNADDSAQVMYIAAIYDEKDRLVNVAATTFEETEGLNVKDLSVSTSTLSAGTYKAKGFVWNAEDISPLGMQEFDAVTVE